MPRCKECGQEVEPRSGVSFGRADDLFATDWQTSNY